MTRAEFESPGFTAEQWRHIDELAVALKPGQSLWISGYFAGLERGRNEARGLPAGGEEPAGLGGPVAVAAEAAQARALTILYGSETGNSAALARRLLDRATASGLRPTLADMARYKFRGLKDEADLIVIASTHGDGDPPQSAVGFFEDLEGRKAPKLPHLRYAVLALGDSSYEHYCEAGRRIDRRLTELGATPLLERVDCDVDYEDAAERWMGELLTALAPASPVPAAAAAAAGGHPAALTKAAAPAFDKKNPFPATVIENIVLSGRGSTKETRHVELSLDGSGLAHEPGDALGIMPRNDPALVTDILEVLSLSAESAVRVKGRDVPLGEALAAQYEITGVTSRFLDVWAVASGAAELQDMVAAPATAPRRAFLRSHHLIDILRRFPVSGVDPAVLLSGLRPLQPRLYSIASSLMAAPDEVHLTVTSVRYALHGQARHGVATGHLASRAEPDQAVPVYVQPNPHFRLPADDRPIIMVGAGTGVAPFRAFLQEREARGAGGRSWLFFGERNFHTDFLYQIEWQQYLADGVLSRLNVAFSRDRAGKTYVQHRMAEAGRDIWAWLEEGAHFYVCGDAQGLAPGVHAALLGIAEKEGGLSPETAADYLGNLQREERYQLDVY